MKILLVSATSLEIKGLLQSMTFSEKPHQKMMVYSHNHHEIHVLITGVGMVSTAFWAGYFLAKNEYDLILNAGVAGAFDRSLALGEVVRVNSDSFPEMGAEDGEAFLSLMDLELIEDDDYDLSGGVMSVHGYEELRSIGALREVAAITVNTVHGNEESIERMAERADAQIESMEGAAVIFAAMCAKVDVICLRSISNYVERRNKDNWRLQEAVNNLNETLTALLNELQ
jgi:futalosine hydrolase